MAKALKKAQPMSSIDRFFENASLAGALARAEDEATSQVVEVQRIAATPNEPKHEAPRGTTPEAVIPEEAVVAVEIAAPKEKPAKPPVTPKSEPALRIAPPQPTAQPTPPRRNELLRMAPRTGEPVDRQREFQLTRSTDAVLEDLVILYKRATGAELTRSHVLRAVLKAVSERMPELKSEADAIGPLRRPSNAKGFEDAREEFEEQIKGAFLRGMREG